MWNIGINSIVAAVGWFLGNPLLAQVIAALIQLFKDNQDEIFTHAVALVQGAWNSDAKGPEKMLIIKTELMSKFPDVAKSVIDTAAQVAFNYVESTIKK